MPFGYSSVGAFDHARVSDASHFIVWFCFGNPLDARAHGSEHVGGGCILDRRGPREEAQSGLRIVCFSSIAPLDSSRSVLVCLLMHRVRCCLMTPAKTPFGVRRICGSPPSALRSVSRGWLTSGPLRRYLAPEAITQRNELTDNGNHTCHTSASAIGMWMALL